MVELHNKSNLIDTDLESESWNIKLEEIRYLFKGVVLSNLLSVQVHARVHNLRINVYLDLSSKLVWNMREGDILNKVRANLLKMFCIPIAAIASHPLLYLCERTLGLDGSKQAYV